MPDHSPQPSAAEQPHRPEHPPPSSPPTESDVATPKQAEGGAIFQALVEAGCDPMVAYTAERRVNTMASETAAAQMLPVLAEIRQMREDMLTKADLAEFATREDLAGFATKEDLAGFATKEDLAGFATKEDLAGFATKEDLAGFATEEALAGFATKEALAALDRKVEVLVAHQDGLKMLGQMMLGALALLVTVLIAVFGFLFTA